MDKVFKDNDDLGDASSIWIRPLRQLHKHGKPVGPVVTGLLQMQQQNLPIGAFTYTRRNRLIFWPVLPKSTNLASAEGTNLIDHVTLELDNNKSHITSYDSGGTPVRMLPGSRSWRLRRHSNTGINYWLGFLINMEVLQDQDDCVQRAVTTPPNDAKRRIREFESYGTTHSLVLCESPSTVNDALYVYAHLFIITDEYDHHQFEQEMFPTGCINDHVDGWPDGTAYEITLTVVQIGEIRLLAAIACPPGRAREKFTMVFPTLG